ncbi:MAG: MFS transporter [Thermoplasmataceae archaeon]
MERVPKLPMVFLLGFNSLYLGVNYLWISFESLILPTQIGNLVPEYRMGLILGIVAAVGAGSGILGNLLSGYLSDRIRILGSRRAPFIAIGVALATVTVLLEGLFVSSLLVIVVGYIFLQVFSNIAIGSVQPVVAETVSADQRGISAGFNGLFTFTGSALGFGITGFLMTYYSQTVAMYSIAAGLIITGTGAIITLIYGKISPMREHHIHISGLMHMPKDLRSFQRLTAGSFMVFMGVTGLTYFELYFFKQVLNVTNPQIYVAVAGIVVLAISAVVTVALGHFSDRIGRWRIMAADAAFAAIPTALIPFFRSFYVFLILGALIGSSYGTFYSVSSAMAGDLAPKQEAGKYMALFNLALAGASTISPLIYGSILFLLSSSVHYSYVALFSTSSAFYLIGSVLILNASRFSGSVGKPLRNMLTKSGT